MWLRQVDRWYMVDTRGAVPDSSNCRFVSNRPWRYERRMVLTHSIACVGVPACVSCGSIWIKVIDMCVLCKTGFPQMWRNVYEIGFR